MSRTRVDARQNVGEPRLRIDAVHFGGDDEAVRGGGALAAAVGAAEQPRLPAESNLAFILPIVGQRSKSIIRGIRCTGDG